MRVSDIMSRKVISLMPGNSIRHAAQIMRRYGVSGLPVIDAGHLVGILTEGDLLRRTELGFDDLPGSHPISVEGAARDYVRSHAWQVADVMSSPVVTVSDVTPLRDAAELMATRGIKRLPVLVDGVLVGMLSRSDFLKVIAQPRLDRVASGDVAVCRAAKARVDELGLFTPPLEVTIESGVVHLWGKVRSRAERDAARVAIESLPGLDGFVDHLEIAAPLSGAP